MCPSACVHVCEYECMHACVCLSVFVCLYVYVLWGIWRRSEEFGFLLLLCGSQGCESGCQAWLATLQPQNFHLPSYSPNGWLTTDTHGSARVLRGWKQSLYFTHQAHLLVRSSRASLKFKATLQRCLCFHSKPKALSAFVLRKPNTVLFSYSKITAI